MIIKAIKTNNSKITAKYEDSIYIMDNAIIHRTEKIIKLIKDKKNWSDSQFLLIHQSLTK